MDEPQESEKSGSKSGKNVPGGFTGADDPRRGRGPKPGAPNAGRPKNEHVEFCKKLLESEPVRNAVKAILEDPKHPQFATLYGKIDSRGHGAHTPAQVQIPITPEHLTDEQLQRIANGEDPLIVLATSRSGFDEARDDSSTVDDPGDGGVGAPAPEGGSEE